MNPSKFHSNHFTFCFSGKQYDCLSCRIPAFAGILILLTSGCAALFGWNIHAPGIMSQEFHHQIQPLDQRIGLYIPAGQKSHISDDKGTRFSDPQKYHIGESFVPMQVEAFQKAFSEFILVETVPTTDILKQYAIPYLVVVDIEGFRNRKDMQGQGLDFFTQTAVFGQDLQLLARFQSKGSSDARKVFAKKGGPEVNLNAALESNLRSVILSLQDWMRSHE